MLTPARGPLRGLTVLVTRPGEQAGPLVEALAAAGATPVVHPTIRIAEPESWAPLDAAGQRSWDWLVLTSPTAARLALPRLPPGIGRRVAVVGRATARAAADAGRPADLVAEDERQEGLAVALAPLVSQGTTVLFPQAAGGRDHLAGVLTGRGCTVAVVPAYRTVAVLDGPPPPPADVAIFASPSAVQAFVTRCGASCLQPMIVEVIGPTTAAAARALGVRVDVVADQPSPEALVTALVRHRAPPR